MEEEGVSSTVRDLFEAKAQALGLKLAGGANGLPNRITSNRIQKLGLAFSGYTGYVHPGMVQFVGETEVNYLSDLDDKARKEAVRGVFEAGLCCVVVTAGLAPPKEILQDARQFSIPVLTTGAMTERVIDELTSFIRAS